VSLFARIRFASVWDLSISAGLAMIAAVVLGATTKRPGGEVLVGVLFGFAVGLGLMALGVYRRDRLGR